MIRGAQMDLTYKQLFLLMEAAESKIRWFEDRVARLGSAYDGEDIEGWEGNDIALLRSTAQELRGILESMGRLAQAEFGADTEAASD